MLACVARGCIGYYFAILVVPHGASRFCALSPATDAGHQIECFPIRKCVVCCVDDDQASATLDVIIEFSPQIFRPVGGVEIQDDCFVLAELGLEAAEVAVVRGAVATVTWNIPAS